VNDRDAGSLAEASLAQFRHAMAEHENPGAAPQAIGRRPVAGWILARDGDGTTGTTRAVVGVDGTVYVRRAGGALRPRPLTASAWVDQEAGAGDRYAAAVAFASRLSELLALNGLAEGD
jgi:hypothetical protein